MESMKEHPMSRWLIRIGVVCLVLGGALISPLSDLLPVETVAFLDHPLAFLSQPASSPNHFRIVPGDGQAEHIGDTLVIVGFVLAGAGLLARRRADVG
jgi:hypothetical protein